MLRSIVHTSLALLALSSLSAHAQSAQLQEIGPWYAASSSAKAITGDLAISGYTLSLNFARFPLAEIRSLTPAELSAAFDADNGQGSGHLYRLDIPPTKRFQHHNTLCGSEATEWMVSYVSERTLQVAFFSGQTMPVLTLDAMTHSTSLCGTYTYTR
jgi:hypothetical protein